MTSEYTTEDIEFIPECEVTLGDGQCWVRDPDYLLAGSEAEGVIALQYTAESGLWYLDGRTRKWIRADSVGPVASVARVQ